MLIFREIKNEDMDVVIYGAFDNSQLMGIGEVELRKGLGILKKLYILPEFRGSNMGEALLRSILNKLDTMGIYTIDYYGVDSYLLKKGFETLENRLSLNIPMFFKNHCGNCNEV